MALAACLLGYSEVGLWFKREAARHRALFSKVDTAPHEWSKKQMVLFFPAYNHTSCGGRR